MSGRFDWTAGENSFRGSLKFFLEKLERSMANSYQFLLPKTYSKFLHLGCFRLISPSYFLLSVVTIFLGHQRWNFPVPVGLDSIYISFYNILLQKKVFACNFQPFDSVRCHTTQLLSYTAPTNYHQNWVNLGLIHYTTIPHKLNYYNQKTIFIFKVWNILS